MKRLALLFLAFSLSLSIVSCSESKPTTNLVDSYKSAAQKFIDSGDIDSAKKALEEGFSATQDPSLKAMLDTLSVPDFLSYAGTWTEETPSLILSIFADSENIGILLTSKSTDKENFEVAYKKYAVAELTSNTVTFDFEDNEKRHSETLNLTFLEDSIECEISNATASAEVSDSFSNGKYILKKNDSIYNGYSYILEEYTVTIDSYTKPKEQEPAAAPPATPAPAPQPQPTAPTQENTGSPKADSYYGALTYPVPITCYTLSTGHVTTYYGDDLNGGTGYIDGAKDQCVIHEIVLINGTYYAKVTYPGVNRYAYAPLDRFCDPDLAIWINVFSDQTVYKRADLVDSIGTVFSTDEILLVGETDTTVQIIYPTINGYKMGWIPASEYYY